MFDKPYKTFRSLFGINLSDNSDPNFKIAQILKIGRRLMFDLRQTNKGLMTKSGICLSVPEFVWFKESLLAEDGKSYVLEHNCRKICLDKKSDAISISQTKYDGTVNKLLINRNEIQALVNAIEVISTNLMNKALDLKLDIDFNQFDYFNMYTE